MRCTCRSYCLTFNPETQSFEGEGELVPKSTAANHRREDLQNRNLDTFTEDVAAKVLKFSPSDEFRNRHTTPPGLYSQQTPPPGSHNWSPPDDLYFVLETETVYRCTWTPTNRSLVFAMEPSPSLLYRYPSASEIHAPNREPYHLDPENVANVVYLENENRLCEILVSLGRRPASNFRDRLIARVCEGLAMMEHHKGAEWNRQKAGSIARHHGHKVVDTSKYRTTFPRHGSQTQN